MNIVKAYRSGLVQRYHQNPDLARLGQTNSAHQWGVCLFVTSLHPNPSKELIQAALTHDVGEIDVGDLSGPFKRREVEFAEQHRVLETHAREAILGGDFDLTEDDHRWLDFCDKLEACCFVLLHRPDVAQWRGWPEMIEGIRKMSRGFGQNCSQKVNQLLDHVGSGDNY